mgnify:CR=1 FL=1
MRTSAPRRGALRRPLGRGGLAADQSLGAGGGGAADRTDSGQLVYALGAGEQLRHTPERLGAEIEVKPGENDPHARIGKVEGQRHQFGTEKLRLVDSHHVHALRRERAHEQPGDLGLHEPATVVARLRR